MQLPRPPPPPPRYAATPRYAWYPKKQYPNKKDYGMQNAVFNFLKFQKRKKKQN